jgi:hypothetical protein
LVATFSLISFWPIREVIRLCAIVIAGAKR